MEKRTSGIWLKWMFLCLLFGTMAWGGAVRAQGVPGAIKYQAVLRDVEGEPMANRDGLDVRISLRQGSPAGTILYQETHTGLMTDAFGLLLLEIGRGDVDKVEGGFDNLLEIPWENSPIYAQVEVQADDNGFTMLGASELLSVPYALYAGNASVGMGLTDGYLPKYDAGYMNLVDSRISETPGGVLQFYAGDNAYTFPLKRGSKNQALTLIDDAGTLGWRTGGGGGGADCDGCQDGRLTYWDDVNGQLRTSDMRYDEPTGAVYAGSQFISPELMIVEKELEINATVSGKHNLQYSTLPKGYVWVGGADGKSFPHKLGGGVTIDSSDKANPVLEFGGGGGASVWEHRSENGIDYVHTKINPDKRVRVGVGTKDPETRFHMQDGSFLLSGTEDGTGDAPIDWKSGNHFYWHSGTGALRMGKFDQESGLWSEANLGKNSIALGTNAEAMAADNVAIGKDAKARGESAMVFGRNAVAENTALALGTNIRVSAANAVGIGSGYSGDPNNPDFVVEGNWALGIGYNIRNSAESAVSVGQSNNVGLQAANSVVVGSDNNVTGEYNIAVGSLITNAGGQSASSNIQMGRMLAVQGATADAISIGGDNTLSDAGNGICLGNGLEISNTGLNSRIGINIGYGNHIQVDATSSGTFGPVLLGHNLTNSGKDGGVVLGRFNADPVHATDPALIVGVGTSKARKNNALELDINGNMWLPGSLSQTSDLTLKTDIQPLSADFSVLQALQPVRYRFKSDKKQQLQFGFIAQDVEQYFPHLVHTGSKGLKSLNYIGLLPVLWQYTQQLERTVETQASEIDRLKTELESLKTEVEAIKAAIEQGH